MTVPEAAALLKMNPQSLRLAFQRKELPQFGIAYRNQADTGWRYIVNENEVRKYVYESN